MRKQPETPAEWEDPANTLFVKSFRFNGTPDLECLMRLVKNNIYDGGNSGYLRARLLGVLRAMYWRENALFWERQKHPKTYRTRVWFKEQRRSLQRRFNTIGYRRELMMCKLLNESIKEETENDNKN